MRISAVISTSTKTLYPRSDAYYIVIAPVIAAASATVRRSTTRPTTAALKSTTWLRRSMLKSQYPQVDPSRIGIIGWSHGGTIALPRFCGIRDAQGGGRDGPGDEPVSAPRLERRRAAAPGHRPQNGSAAPHERQDVYKDRSPLYQVDKLQIPLYVGVTRNDQDVNIEATCSWSTRCAPASRSWPRRRSTTTRPAATPRPRRSENVAAGKHPRAARFVEPRVDVPRLEPGSVPRRQLQRRQQLDEAAALEPFPFPAVSVSI